MFVEECKTVRFGDVARVIHGFPFKSELYAPDDGTSPRVVSIGNFDYSGGFRIGGDWKVYKGHYPSNYDLNPGDVLLVMTCQTEGGEILGIPATIPDDGRSYLHNQRLGRIHTVRPDCADLRFLYWVCLMPAFNDELCASASGTKIQHTAPSRIESFEFQLPDLESQRRIANALDALDSRIALNEKLNAALEATAAAVFKSWFVDFDPVVAKSVGRKPFGMTDEIATLFPDRFAPNGLPEGWKPGELSDLADVVMGQSPPGESYNQDRPGTLFFQGRTDFGNRFPSERLYTTAPSRMGRQGDILVSVRAPVGDVNIALEDCCVGRGLGAVRSKGGHQSFIYYLLRSMREAFEQFEGGGTVFGSISGPEFRGLKIVAPDMATMKAFEDIVSVLDARILLNHRQNRALRNLRDAILPGLVSGELQIKDLQKEAVAL